MYVKTNIGLVEYCKAQLGLPYWYGTFGQIATQSLLSQKSAQYPAQYKHSDFIEQYGKRVHDCVGLIKGYLWCNSPTASPVYNVAQDKDVSGMLANCSVNGNISTMPDELGVLVFMDGHVGVYIGNGKVIEARGHLYGVVETKLKERKWIRWGKLDWLTYRTAKLFDEGEAFEALDYLVKHGRITNRDLALKKLDIIKDEDWIFIKWANDVKKLED